MPKGLFACLILLALTLAACGEDAAKNEAPAQSATQNATAQNSTQQEAAPAQNATARPDAQGASGNAPAQNATQQAGQPAAPASAATPDEAAAAAVPDAAAPAGAVQEPAPTGAELETAKWNSYVILANDTDPAVLAALEDYVANFPEREYLAPGEGFEYQRPATGGALPRGVAGALDQALFNAAREPQSDLDDIALAYGQALKNLWLALSAAANYYTGGEYKADAAARGAALHEAVVEAAMAYGPLSDAFGRALLRRDEDMMRESVAALRADGLELHAAILDVVLGARETERELGRQSLDASAPPAFDAPAWNKAEAAFAQSCQTLEKGLADAEQRRKEDLSAESAAELAAAAKAMREYAAGVAGAVRDHAAQKGEAPLDLAGGFAERMNAFIVSVNARLQ